jgi:ABC-type uncharacterized transport system permease subunit
VGAISLGPVEVARLCGAVLGGAMIFFATFVLGGAWAFVTVDGSEVVNAFTYGGTTVAATHSISSPGRWPRGDVGYSRWPS